MAMLHEPWRYDTLNEADMVSTADTGDILLFKNSKFAGSVIRTFTGGNFDHIAILIRSQGENNEMYYFDATGNNNVCYGKWSSIRNHIGKDKFYVKCVYRRVKFECTDNALEKFQKFLDEANKQEYEFSFEKLKRKNSKTEVDEGREIIDIDRTFFCSELLAKAFKVLGIFKPDS